VPFALAAKDVGGNDACSDALFSKVDAARVGFGETRTSGGEPDGNQ
jgi:hypothetical protein